MANVTYGFSVQVGGGPQIAKTLTTTVEAYDVLDFELAAGANGINVDVQPGGSGSIKLLSISSSLYDGQVSYTVLDAGGNKGPFTLDAPQFFSGGAIGVIGVAPKTLAFTNANAAGDPTKNATIEIFVGRDATP